MGLQRWQWNCITVAGRTGNEAGSFRWLLDNRSCFTESNLTLSSALWAVPQRNGSTFLDAICPPVGFPRSRPKPADGTELDPSVRHAVRR